MNFDVGAVHRKRRKLFSVNDLHLNTFFNAVKDALVDPAAKTLIDGVPFPKVFGKPWKYNKKLYKGRNVVERNFRKIKQFRRVFTRYDKLDERSYAFIAIASIAIFMKN